MRSSTVGLAAALFLVGLGTGTASTGPVSLQTPEAGAAPGILLGRTPINDGDVMIARRGRGADDKGKDDHGGRRHGKHKGGHDDGPKHDRNDDHGKHGRKHT